MSLIALFVAIIIVCSFISLPFGVVPITLQTFAIVCTCAFLGTKKGFVSVLIYVLLGLVGLPVFHNFQGGIGVVLGSTGGFILGFLLFPLIIGKGYNENKNDIKRLFALSLLATAMDYVLGVLWFCFIYLNNQGFKTALLTCVVPFVLPDTIKIIVACITVKRLKKLLIKI
jgi:biotin transport system substrate-specific component